jgi:hypothetical protein
MRDPLAQAAALLRDDEADPLDEYFGETQEEMIERWDRKHPPKRPVNFRASRGDEPPPAVPEDQPRRQAFLKLQS